MKTLIVPRDVAWFAVEEVPRLIADALYPPLAVEEPEDRHLARVLYLAIAEEDHREALHDRIRCGVTQAVDHALCPLANIEGTILWLNPRISLQELRIYIDSTIPWLKVSST